MEAGCYLSTCCLWAPPPSFIAFCLRILELLTCQLAALSFISRGRWRDNEGGRGSCSPVSGLSPVPLPMDCFPPRIPLGGFAQVVRHGTCMAYLEFWRETFQQVLLAEHLGELYQSYSFSKRPKSWFGG